MIYKLSVSKRIILFSLIFIHTFISLNSTDNTPHPFSKYLNNSLGQRFIFALPQNNSKKNLKRWLKNIKPAGIILFSKDLGQKQKKIKQTINSLQKTAEKNWLAKTLYIYRLRRWNY